MPRALVRLGEPEFVSAGRARQLTGCGHTTLYRLVAQGLVEVRLDHFEGTPRYRIADVRKYTPGKPGRPRNNEPVPKTRGKRTAMA